MTIKRLRPIHPGEILEEEFMRPLALSANSLAKAIDVPVTRISEIVRGRRGITADTALRLARLLGTSAEVWMGLQAEYDLRTAKRESGDEIERRVSRLRVSPGRYESSGAGPEGRLEVREARTRYGTDPAWRTRDRRRDRRSKDGPR